LLFAYMVTGLSTPNRNTHIILLRQGFTQLGKEVGSGNLVGIEYLTYEKEMFQNLCCLNDGRCFAYILPPLR